MTHLSAEQPRAAAHPSRPETEKLEVRSSADPADARLASEYHSLKRWLMQMSVSGMGWPTRTARKSLMTRCWPGTASSARQPALKTIRHSTRQCCGAGRATGCDAGWSRPSRWTPSRMSALTHRSTALVAEREELRDLHEVAKEALHPQGYTIVRLAASGVRRTVVAKRFGLRLRQVKRVRERARATLEAAWTRLEEQGRCAMVASTLADIGAGTVGPTDPRAQGGDRTSRALLAMPPVLSRRNDARPQRGHVSGRTWSRRSCRWSDGAARGDAMTTSHGPDAWVRLASSRRDGADALGVSLSHFQRHVQPHLRCIYSGQLRLYPVTDLDIEHTGVYSSWASGHAFADRHDRQPMSQQRSAPCDMATSRVPRPAPPPQRVKPLSRGLHVAEVFSREGGAG
jgi:hypothetical protein